MANNYIKIPINCVSKAEVSDLAVGKASDLAYMLLKAESAALVECMQVKENGLFYRSDDEIVVFDVSVKVGQRPAVDIRYTERIAVLFSALDNVIPIVFALRDTFPKVPHLINFYFSSPVCLCIYEQVYADLKLEWRPQRFLDDIRNWLSKTAVNQLHEEDQPMEPLLQASCGRLILPTGLDFKKNINISLVSNQPGIINLLASNSTEHVGSAFHCLYFEGAAQEHGIIHETPQSLFQLHEFLLKAKIDIFERIKAAGKANFGNAAIMSAQLVLLVRLPKTDKARRSSEYDLYAFVTQESMQTIGVKINAWEVTPEGRLGVLIQVRANLEKAKTSPIDIFIPFCKLTKQDALFFSGSENDAQRDIVITQIGTGALGSQLFINVAKTGWGNWKLVDDDVLLPHNSVRHALSSLYTGYPKSDSLAAEANAYFGSNFVESTCENYLSPTSGSLLNDFLHKSDLILDVSTSIAVERDLADRKELKPRRVSMFLNPSGKDLIILAEDTARKFPLDILEFQYYRELNRSANLNEHLKGDRGVRYSNSCRDITTRIPQALVALHAAIAGAQLKKIAGDNAASIAIWQANDDLEVKKTQIQVEQFRVINKGVWTIYIDSFLIQKIAKARLGKLPNETGGILIGGYDFQRRKVYLVDTVLSPKDSDENPVSYVRGIEGLKKQLSDINTWTVGHLGYAGEWHSHPDGCSLSMSGYDIILFDEISREMSAIGLPPLMLIAGDNEKIALYIEDKTV